MRDLEITLPRSATDEQIIALIEQGIASTRLTITMRASLKRFPGCVHWHVKLGRETGTLEITFWPLERRAWFTIQDGRKADWIEQKAAEVEAQIAPAVKPS